MSNKRMTDEELYFFDTVGYLKAMHKAGWTDFITLEVSGIVWG